MAPTDFDAQRNAEGEAPSSATRDFRILVIGAGKMGEAIVAGWIACDTAPADVITAASVSVANPGLARRQHMESVYGVTAYADATEAPAADVVVLAVKPQVMMGVLESIANKPAFGPTVNPLFISIAAGISTAKLEQALPKGARVVRVMPNTPLMVGAGASGVCGGVRASESDVAFVRDLFACLGEAVVVDEADMDAVCGGSGAGPAYVAAMIEALRDAAAAEGLDPSLAEKLATQTVYGTAKLMLDRAQSAEETRIAVCSPGGTTLAALDAMHASGFNDVFKAGVSACVKRSKELGS